MRLYKIFFSITAFLILLSSEVDAQGSPKDFNQIIAQFNNGLLSANDASLQMKALFEGDGIYKCGTPIQSFVYKHRNEISTKWFEEQKNKSSLASYISASGKFELTYETTGGDAVPTADTNTNGVPDYVERAAEAADFSYQKQIQELGFPDPIPSGATYNLSFRDFGFYGATRTDNSQAAGTRIIIENDFDGFPPNDDPEGDQYGALKVTIAHELKHAIQYVQNDFSGDSDQWAEMDATMLEEVTYDEVNDYYNYLDGSEDNPFNNPGVSVIPGFNQVNYEDVTWALFFSEFYDELFWTDVWKRIEDSTTDLALLVAVKREVEKRGDDFGRVLSELYLWHYSSGVNAVAGYGFDEAVNYPNPRIEAQYLNVSEAFIDSVSISRFASNYYEILSSNEDGQVSLHLESEIPFIQLGVNVFFKNGTSNQRFYMTDESGEANIFMPYNWRSIDKVGLVITNTQFNEGNIYTFRASSETPDRIELAQNYPNPFDLDTIISVTLKTENRIKLEVYDYTGRFISKIFEGTLSAGSYEIPFNASNLASGVYLYKLETGGKSKFRTMTIIN